MLMVSAAPKFRWLSLSLFTALLIVAPCTAVITISDTTISDTLVVPADDSADLSGVVTLDNGVIEVFGDLDSRGDDIEVIGNGQVILRQPQGRWNYVSNIYDGVLVGSGVEVRGENGTQFYSQSVVNQGTIAAIGTGSSTGGFRISNTWGFENQGVLEARDGGRLWIVMFSNVNDFNPTGLIRANPGGIVRFEGPPLDSLADLGTLENQGGIVELHRSTLNNVGQTTTFTGGDWDLMRTRINQGTLETSGTGRLVIAPYRSGSFVSDSPVEFNNVNLSTDLFFRSQGRLTTLNGLTLANKALRFEDGTGYFTLPADNVTGLPQLSGTGSIVAGNGGTARLEADGGVVTLPASIGLLASDGLIQLTRPSGVASGEFDIYSPILADSGSIQNTFPATSRSTVTVTNGGQIRMESNWTSHGSINIQNDGLLRLRSTLDNQGTVSINGGHLVLRGGEVTGPGSFSITNSTLYANAYMTLTDFLSLDGVGVDQAIASGGVNLEGSTIALGQNPGERWTLTGGDLHNGVVNSADGAELNIAESPAGTATGNLYDLELNADVRVTAGSTLNITGPLTGTGYVVVDGGTLNLGRRLEDSFVSNTIPRITPLGGKVVFSGPVDNSGNTITLRAGLDWEVSHLRSDAFKGGRIEGEPGTELRIVNGYNYPNTGYATFKQGITLAIPTIVDNTEASVRDGLNLDNVPITIGIGTEDEFYGSRLAFHGEQTLGGAGEIRFSGINGFPSDPNYPRINMIQVLSSVETEAGLTIGPGITVRTSDGSGYIGGNYFYQLPPAPVPLSNEGLLLAENGHSLTLFVSDMAQTGTLLAKADSTLRVSTEQFLNEGLVEATGGVLEFSGDFAQDSEAELRILLADPTAPAAIQVEGVATLGGTLDILLADDLVPEIGDSFGLLFANGGSGGEFDTVNLPNLETGKQWLLNPGGSTLFLEVREAPNADMNLDGNVDAGDFLAWQRNPSLGTLADWEAGFGVGTFSGDFNSDGNVDARDFLAWQRNPSSGKLEYWSSNYGLTLTSNASTVPEPSALALAPIALLLPLRRCD